MMLGAMAGASYPELPHLRKELQNDGKRLGLTGISELLNQSWNFHFSLFKNLFVSIPADRLP